ncbi:DUF883 family protein [Thalassococcus sp. BH17M4-6]|uniref:DUF883 family protein n=1 Tax=Thalassococcus sp. BH17M4-6 TaxID=3413148 RepID=UPI003BDEB925
MATTTTTAASKSAQSPKSDYDELSDQMKTIRSDISSLTELLSEIGVRRKDETLEAARERAKRMRNDASDKFDDARDQANEMRDQALDAVRRQPGTAIAIAVGVGFLAGVFSGRR